MMETFLIIFGLIMDVAGAALIIRPIMDVLFYKTRFQLEEELEDLNAKIRIMQDPNSGYMVTDDEGKELLEHIKKDVAKIQHKILNFDKEKYEKDRQTVWLGLGLIVSGFILQITAYVIQLGIFLTT